MSSDQEQSILREWYAYLLTNTCKLLAPTIAFGVNAICNVLIIGAIACAGVFSAWVVFQLWGLLF